MSESPDRIKTQIHFYLQRGVEDLNVASFQSSINKLSEALELAQKRGFQNEQMWACFLLSYAINGLGDQTTAAKYLRNSLNLAALFAASDIDGISEVLSTFVAWTHEPKYRDILVMVAEISSRPEKLVEFLVNTFNGNPNHGVLPHLAYRCLKASSAWEDMRLRQLVAEPLIAMVQDRDAAYPDEYARALGSLGLTSTVEPLIAALQDSRPWVRHAAADALGDIGDSRAVEPLIAALKTKGSEEELRWSRCDLSLSAFHKATVLALGKIGGAKAITAIADALDYVIGASKVLEEIGDPAIPDVIRIVKSKPGWYEYGPIAAARVLGVIGNPMAAKSLLEVLRDPCEDMRRAVAVALEQVCEGNAGKIGGDAIKLLVFHFANQEDEEISNFALRILNKLDDVRVFERALIARRESYTIAEKASYFRRYDDDSLIEKLGYRFSYEDRCAAYILGERQCRRAIRPLITALRKERAELRWEASYALGNIGSPKATKALIRVLDDPEMPVQWLALNALGKIGDPQVITPVLNKLRDPHEYLRWEAACVLGQLCQPNAIPALRQCVQEEDRSTLPGKCVAWAAARSAKKLRISRNR